MKSLAEFKRNAATGKMSLELVERFGKTEIPENMRGVRKVSRVNTVAVMLHNANGTESELRLDCGAKLVEYDEKYLIIYSPGLRDLTDEEKNILKEWSIEEKEYYKNNPYGDSYWLKQDFFEKSACPWMVGSKTVKGKRYDFNSKVRDNAIKGERILKYIVYAEGK